MNRGLKMGLGVLALGLVAQTAIAGKKGDPSWTQTWNSDSEQHDFAYALVEPTDHGGSLFLSGTERDRDELLRLRERVDGSFVWMRSGQKRSLIRNRGVIERAQEILEPELELSRSQGRLGELQGRLGESQGRLGEEQGRLGEEQARLGERQARIAGRAVSAGSQNATRQRELEREQEELGEVQEELGRTQERLSRRQEQMGREQWRLGEEQKKFEEHRKEICQETRRQMRGLLEDAASRGLTEKP